MVPLVVIWVSFIFWLYKWKHAKPSAHEVNGRDNGSFHCVYGWSSTSRATWAARQVIFGKWEFKTESKRKLINFQWKKTLYLNIFKTISHSFWHFSWAIDIIKLSVKTSKKISYGSPRKSMSNFTKWHVTYEIFRILPVFSQFLWNLTLIFLGSYEK